MIFVGDHVKLIGAITHHIGTVVAINANGQLTLEYMKPVPHKYFAHENDVYKVTDKVWYDYLGLEGKTGNHIIDHAPNNGMSIDQMADDWDNYFEGDLEALKQASAQAFYEYDTHILAKPEFYVPMTEDDLKPYAGSDTTYLSKSEKEDLKQMYIELALLTGDEAWFLELTKEEGK